jgi:hypothetical protein
VPPDVALPEAPRPEQPIHDRALWGGREKLDFALVTDGVVRRVPLLLHDDAGPGLILSAICSVDGASSADLRRREGNIEVRGAPRPESATGVHRRIPVDHKAPLQVDFAHPPADPAR